MESANSSGPHDPILLPNDWGTMDPIRIVKTLAKLVETAGLNPKTYIPKTYSRFSHWNKLDEKQKLIVVSKWNGMPDLLREQIVKNLTGLSVDLTGDDSNGVNWNKHDWSRLIHMLGDSRLLSLFTKLSSVKTREELDDKNGFVNVDAMVALTDAFNDYDTYKYQNPTFITGHDGHKHIAIGMGSAFPYCGDLNPCDSNRPERTAAEFSTHLKKFKGLMTIAYTNYMKSGQHEDDEDSIGTFRGYIDGDIKCLYGFVVLNTMDISFLGRILSEDGQADTGVIGATVASHTTHTTRKRKSYENHGDYASPAPDYFIQQSIQIKAMEVLMQHGGAEVKERAIRALSELAFPTHTTPNSSERHSSGRSSSSSYDTPV